MATRIVFKDEMRPAIGPTPGPWRYLRHDGASIHNTYDLAEMGLAWQPDIMDDQRFQQLVLEVKHRFMEG